MPSLRILSLGTKEDVILKSKDNPKNIVASKFEEKLWCDEELED
jgi:hypothetical protein